MKWARGSKRIWIVCSLIWVVGVPVLVAYLNVRIHNREAAFWDTLWADRPRDAAALAFLRDAVRHDPRDGRSQFLLGMLHLYRSGGDPATFDFTHPTEAGKREARAAQEPLDRAVELLPRDTRVPGFRAADSDLWQIRIY